MGCSVKLCSVELRCRTCACFSDHIFPYYISGRKSSDGRKVRTFKAEALSEVHFLLPRPYGTSENVWSLGLFVFGAGWEVANSSFCYYRGQRYCLIFYKAQRYSPQQGIAVAPNTIMQKIKSTWGKTYYIISNPNISKKERVTYVCQSWQFDLRYKNADLMPNAFLPSIPSKGFVTSWLFPKCLHKLE